MSERKGRRTAEKKRESRHKHTEIHKQSTFITQYVQIKYERIYEEANNFYSKLSKQYPIKRKLSTAPEYQVWEHEIKKAKTTERCDVSTSTVGETTTDVGPCLSTVGETTTDVDPCLNIQLMDKDDIQETRDNVLFQNIFPSVIDEINPEIIQEVINEIHESGADIFNDDDDDEIDKFINQEIQDSLNELSPLEKELLNY